MTCEPSYLNTYQPVFVPRPPPSIGKDPVTDCATPLFIETRARLQNETLYRTKLAGTDQNNIAVEFTAGLILNVYYFTGSPPLMGSPALVESFGPVPPDIIVPTCTPVSAPALRVLVNAGSSFIEMPSIDHGGTTSTVPTFDASIDDDCMVPFGPTNLTGGAGPPTDDSILGSVRTGPQRSMIIVQSTEIVTGTPSDIGFLVDPPPSRRVQQYDGTTWISFCNLVQGNCPLDGTCTP